MFDIKNGALLFDCDGTITDESFLPKIVGLTIQEIIEEQGCIFCSDTFHRVFESNKGGGFDKYYLGYLNSIHPNSILDVVSCSQFSERATEKYLQKAADIVNGIDTQTRFTINQDTLNAIKWGNMNNIPVGIVTNANPSILRANLGVAGIGIDGETTGKIYADAVVDKSHYGKDASKRKPSDFPYKRMCEILSEKFSRDIIPEHSVGFEDSANGHLSLKRANIGLRIHVCEEHPKEPVYFIQGKEKFGPDAIAPYGRLSSQMILDLIDKKNNTETVVSMDEFSRAAYNDSLDSSKPLSRERSIVAQPS